MTRLKDSLGKKAAWLSAFARGQPSAPAVPTGVGGSNYFVFWVVPEKSQKEYAFSIKKLESTGANQKVRPHLAPRASCWHFSVNQASLRRHTNVDPFLYFSFYKAGVRCICVLLSLPRPLGTLPFV